FAEVMVETDHSVHFGARQVECVGDLRHGLGGHAAELVLHGVQDLEQRPRFAGKLLHGIGHAAADFFGLVVHESGDAPVTRHGCVYTLQPPGRRKATSVMPADSANSTASVEGAPMAATSGAPAIMAFCNSSKLARPDSSTMRSRHGNSPANNAAPTSLSMALWRPTSSRLASSSPRLLN